MRISQSLFYSRSVRMLSPLTLLLAIPAFGQSGPMQAQQADAFVGSIGVGTDLTYPGVYQNSWSYALQDLQNLGVRHIRDGYFTNNSCSQCISEHQALHQSGIGANYVIPYSSSTTAQDIETLSSQVQDMESIEAPNECDNGTSCGSNPTTGVNNMLAFLPTLDQAGSALGIPVIGPSFLDYDYAEYSNVGNLSSEMTYNNLHIYFGGMNPGTPPWGNYDQLGNGYDTFPFGLDQAYIDGPNVPVWLTESGYIETPTTDSQEYVPQDVAASYVPRTLLLAFQAGFRRAFLFQLVTDPSWGQDDYGLVNPDSTLSPRPAYVAVQNLIANLSDPGASFTPNQLPVSITVAGGADPNLKEVLLQKRDGSFWLILWREVSSWDASSDTYIPVQPDNVTVTVDSSYQIPNVLQFDDTGNVTTTSLQGPSSESWSVSDQLTIFKILAK
jgi:hypothetical protein